MHPERKLDEFAARQYGVFSLRQARSVGLSRKMIETRRVNGAWIELAPSIYALASAPPKWEREMAAAMLMRSGAVAAGRSAAYLHGFEGFRPERPVIMIGSSGNGRSELATIMRSKYHDEIETLRVRGFVVTTQAETALTLARELSSTRLEKLIDEQLAAGTLTIDTLATLVDERSGSPGLKRLRPIIHERLPDAYQPPTSELERLLYRLMEDSRVPESTRQMPIRFDRANATVDLFIPAWRLIVEGDGRRWHTRKADMERDRRRDNEATAHGLAVLRFTWHMLTNEAPNCFETLLRTGRIRAAS